MVVRSWAMALLCSILAACAGSSEGKSAIAFEWPDGPPADVTGLWLSVRVEARPAPDVVGEVLRESTVLLEAGEIELSGVANGAHRVVIAEVRTGTGLGDRVSTTDARIPSPSRPG